MLANVLIFISDDMAQSDAVCVATPSRIRLVYPCFKGRFAVRFVAIDLATIHLAMIT